MLPSRCSKEFDSWRDIVCCQIAVINLDDSKLWPLHAVVRCSGRDPAPSGRVRLSLSEHSKISLQQLLLPCRLISFVNLRKGAQSLSWQTLLRGTAHRARCIPPAPPSVTRVKWRLSDIVVCCRLEMMAVMFHLSVQPALVQARILSCYMSVAPRRHCW